MAVKFQKPTGAFVAASWAALLIGAIVYLIGLWNATMQLNEKGYYFTILMYGLFSAVSLQKTVRDRIEGMSVTSIYYGLCWVSLLLSVALLAVGLFNATLAASEKGFYGMAFLLALFGAVAVQKNVRDIAAHKSENPSIDDVPDAG
jgi:uncharacterized membrane protein YiaA